ncbi:Hypothetical predicted protein [Octopus vulgaris]|uniref:Uncharacterized protein n=1 Tax=Octopus vulgaris TaxID=6645 RepID=A0AA36BUW0_OCTVU|nr:Hypothetical predicted protein [Octopus vulgaris]
MLTNSIQGAWWFPYFFFFFITVCSLHAMTMSNNTMYMYKKDRCTFLEYNPTKVIHLYPYNVQDIVANGNKSKRARICTMTFAIRHNERLRLTVDFLRIRTCKVTARLYLLQEMNQLDLRKEFTCNTTSYREPVYLRGGQHYYGILEINKQFQNQTNFYCKAKVTIIPDPTTSLPWPTTLFNGDNGYHQTTAPNTSSHTLLLAIGIVIPLILLIASAFTYHVWRRSQLRINETPNTSFTLTRILRHRRTAHQDIGRSQQSGHQRGPIGTIGELYADPYDILTWEGFFGIFSSMDFPKPVELPPYPGYDPPPPYESIIYDQGLDPALLPPPPPAPAPSIHQMRYHCTMASLSTDNEAVPSPNNGMETTV